MATLGVNWAGVVVTLDHNEVAELIKAQDVATAAAGLAGAIAAPTGPVGPIVIGIAAAYIRVERQLILTVDRGFGVYLTLPWPAIYFSQFWLIIPTTRPDPALGGVTVRRSDGNAFGPNEEWTAEAYYGSIGTVFADVTGNGSADAIVVNEDTVTVRRNTGNGFGANEDWTHGPFYGTRGTFFVDVTGDGKA